MNIRNRTSGFTLVEALVAIAILLTVATLPMTRMAEVFQQGQFSEQQSQAVFLAQEGIEVARSVRDSKRLQAIEGQQGGEFDLLRNNCSGQNGCGININGDISSRLVSCPSSHCSVQVGNSSFTRYLQFSQTLNQNQNKEALIKVTVSWTTKDGRPQTVTQEEYLRSFQ